eukprot:COSAG02_NODE_31_length_50774_cov_1928.118204_8_plen_262_part_00
MPRSYAYEDPYRNDHRFHGWIGLCCFHLAEEANSREAQAGQPRSGSGAHLSYKGVGPTDPSRRRDYAADAREHLLRALELNPREDQYVRCLSQVLLWAGKKSAARNLLMNFCLLNPNNPEGFRYCTKLGSSCCSQLHCLSVRRPIYTDTPVRRPICTRSHTDAHAHAHAHTHICAPSMFKHGVVVLLLDCQIALRSVALYRRIRFRAKLRAAERCFAFGTLRPGLLSRVGYSQTQEQQVWRQGARIASSATIIRRSTSSCD